MLATTIATPTLETYGVTVSLSNPQYSEANIHFRPYISPEKEIDWRESDTTIELISRVDGTPEIHFFGPLRRWTDDHFRDFVRTKRIALEHGLTIEDLFSTATLDLVM